MLIRHFGRRATLSVGLAVAATFATSVFAGPAEDLKEASKLYQQNRFDAALSKINGVLAQSPKDAQGRFLKGLIFTEQKKYTEAIQVFTGLTEDYPELPEPYNNLAVLYAGQGNYDKAKAALELAIHTHPTYATAHENLGDIYAQLARRAYDKALQLDKSNVAAQSKLAMVKDLFTPPRTVVAEAPRTTLSAPAAVPVAAPAKPEPARVSTPVAVAGASAASKPAPPSATSISGDAQEQISALIRNWAAAWAAKDAESYLSYYAADFETPDRLARNAWENQRRQRISAPSFINVDVQISKITVAGNEATAIFRQKYKSDKLASDNTKTVKLVKSGDRWMIRSERAGG